MALLAVIASAAHGVPITVPSGLTPGDQYRLAFVTSTTRDATSSDINVYNDFVTAVAESVPELAALGTTWTAIASTRTVWARTNTNTNYDVEVGVPIYLLNDTVLAYDNFDLWDDSIHNPLIIDEQGLNIGIPHTEVWTGTNGRGGTDGLHGEYGLGWCEPGCRVSSPNDATDYRWVRDLLEPAANQNLLYGISGTLTYIPEPGTAMLLALGLAGLALRGHRQRH
jgi:hypothetical protein